MRVKKNDGIPLVFQLSTRVKHRSFGRTSLYFPAVFYCDLNEQNYREMPKSDACPDAKIGIEACRRVRPRGMAMPRKDRLEMTVRTTRCFRIKASLRPFAHCGMHVPLQCCRRPGAWQSRYLFGVCRISKGFEFFR
jgi:hypothetical protein